ncbi:MAG: hypothetical protein ACJ74Y_18595 [Bryobacteraceae bacterium]
MTVFRNLPAMQIENDHVRVTVSVQGGHIAEILDKKTGLNPLWSPPWPSIDVTDYSPEKYPEYGGDSESKLLAGIMGHNLCLDLFGPPSPEEARSGFAVHGEAASVNFQIAIEGQQLIARGTLPASQLDFERRIRLDRNRIYISETVENLSILDRPVAWTEHVTLGPPFVERGITQIRTTATRSCTLSGGVEFDWPLLPEPGGNKRDLRVFNSAPSSGGYTAHLSNPASPHAWFFAYSPHSNIAIGYVWRTADFPWLGIWEENKSRAGKPWNSRTTTLGMEFGVSPFPESRREMIDRSRFFGVPCYRWIPAKSRVLIEYHCAIGHASAVPESLEAFEDVTS